MYHIKFIATPVKERPEHSGEGVNAYKVEYSPSRGMVQGTRGSTLEGLLVESFADAFLSISQLPHLVYLNP